MSEPFDIEKPACFYLGREYDLVQKAVMPNQYVMYEARDLTTHGVIVGMTGSGKTGMAISLLEEAAIDGIPCIILDPKGDLTNLLLQFPDLAPSAFEEWLNPEDAQQKGMSVPQFAKELSDRWKNGLAETHQTPERIERLRQACEFRVYTPGSESGLPLSILGSFAAPRSKMPLEDLTQKIDALATALLGLTGIAADPIQSREHILIAQLLLHSWKDQKDLDLARLIMQIQNPPIRQVGTYNLETFFPAKDRLKFASSLNNVLASPSFATWTLGEPLDLASMIYRNGKPQQLIFSISHLDDTQRMFFAALLLEEVLSWTRKQTGTTNLRALLYFDEVFGYLPPYPANPPSKKPLLTLLKQARAFGVGVLLATQNPVDLDYKALSNAGTWFIGKLQTERDKARLLEGLESVAAEQGTLTDRAYLETVLSSLGNRVFLLHNVHKQKPILFQSRWALSFLRGPMSRAQISQLMEPVKQRESAAPVMAIPLCHSCHAEVSPAAGDRCPKCGANPWVNPQVRQEDRAFRERLMQAGPAAIPVAQTMNQAGPLARGSELRPVLPPDVVQFYLSRAPWAKNEAGERSEYRPALLGFAEITYVLDKRSGKEHRENHRCLVWPAAPGHPMDWLRAEDFTGGIQEQPLPGVRWGEVPETLDTGRKLKVQEKAFADFLYSTRKLDLWENRSLSLVSQPGESEAAFRQRCLKAADEQKKQALEMEDIKFRPRFEALDSAVPPDEPERKGGVLGWLGFGNSSGTPTNKTEEKINKLTADLRSKRAEIKEKWKRLAQEVVPLHIKPRKADVRVTQFGIAWVPFCQRGEKLEPAHR